MRSGQKASGIGQYPFEEELEVYLLGRRIMASWERHAPSAKVIKGLGLGIKSSMLAEKKNDKIRVEMT